MVVMETMYDFSLKLLSACGQQISGSLLYLDAGAGEVFHSAIGAAALMGAGALNVCDLQRAAAADSLLAEVQGRRVEVLTIMVTQLLPAAHPLVVTAIMAHPGVKVCNIFTSITEHAHACLGATGVEGYAEYSTLMQQELAELCKDKQGGGFMRVPPEVRVHYLPIHWCPLGSNAFVLPAASSAAQLAITGKRAAGWGPFQARNDDEDAPAAASDFGLSLLAHTLAGVVSLLGTSMNIFHVGPVAQQVAQELAILPLPSSPLPEGQVNDHSVAVVLIDRSLDLVTPANPSDHPVDCMLAHLPRSDLAPPAWNAKRGTSTSWRPIDVRADGSPLCPASAPGCPVMGLEVFRPSDKRALQWMDQLLNRKGKDAAALLRKWLKEGLRQEGIPPPIRSKMGSVPPSELQALAEALAVHPGGRVRQACAMALGFAGAQALGGGPSAPWEAAAGLTKQVLQARHSGMDTGQLLLDVLNGLTQGKGMVGLPEVLQLLAAAYSLAGDRNQVVCPIGPKDEMRLRAKLVEAFLLPTEREYEGAMLKDFQTRLQQAQQAAEAGEGTADLQGMRLEAGALVDGLFASLQFVSKARVHLQELHTLGTGTPQDAQAVVPLVCQVVDKILQDEGSADLVHVTSQLRGLLSLGLGHLGLKHSKPKPADSSTVLLFMVGGISLVEVREVYQEVSLHLGHRPRFVLAGTALLTPADVTEKLCGL